MSTLAHEYTSPRPHPVDVRLDPRLDERNRLTTAFRLVLAIPHLLLVGGPAAAGLSWSWRAGEEGGWQVGGGGGLLGMVAVLAAVISWFAILFTGRQPEGLRSLAEFYLRWRVRAVAYTALLRDEYPPFGDGPYPAAVEIAPGRGPRDRLTVAFRLLLAIPHMLLLWVLGIGWAFTSLAAWVSILISGSYPPGLYRFAVGMLRWNTRVEAYLLLLHDEYPPFSLE